MREFKSICKFVCTHVCTSICFPVTINIFCLCASVCVSACVCVCHPRFEDHKYGRGSRQARCLFSVAVDNASEVVTFSHPSIHSSLHPSVFQFLFASRKDTMAFQAAVNLIRPNQSRGWHPTPLQKNHLSLLVFINLSVFLSYTISAHQCSGSHTWRYELKHTCQGLQTHSRNTLIKPCVRSMYSHANRHKHTHRHTHEPGQADRASGPRSLMFVKVINFLCEIRGHGGRTEGDGCQPQNLSLLSSTGTGALWVHSTGPSHGHRGYPRIPGSLTNKGSEWWKRKKTQMKGNFWDGDE